LIFKKFVYLKTTLKKTKATSPGIKEFPKATSTYLYKWASKGHWKIHEAIYGNCQPQRLSKPRNSFKTKFVNIGGNENIFTNP
jgi:hypothetical protein